MEIEMSRHADVRSGIRGSRRPPVRELACRLALLAAVGAAAAGCADSTESVAHLQGVVTVNGNQIPDDAKAFINFAPAAGGTGKSVSVEVIGGHYDSPDTPLGPLLVTFAISRPVGPEKKSDRTGQMYQDVANLVPAKYVTGIPLDVQGDNPNQDFHLTD